MKPMPAGLSSWKGYVWGMQGPQGIGWKDQNFHASHELITDKLQNSRNLRLLSFVLIEHLIFAESIQQ